MALISAAYASEELASESSYFSGRKKRAISTKAYSIAPGGTISKETQMSVY